MAKWIIESNSNRIVNEFGQNSIDLDLIRLLNELKSQDSDSIHLLNLRFDLFNSFSRINKQIESNLDSFIIRLSYYESITNRIKLGFVYNSVRKI